VPDMMRPYPILLSWPSFAKPYVSRQRPAKQHRVREARKEKEAHKQVQAYEDVSQLVVVPDMYDEALP